MSVAPAYIFPCGVSRSGTTLLATILDSHPGISLGYELVPAELPSPETMVALLERAWDESDGHVRRCGNLLKSRGEAALGTFVKRSFRTCVEPPELVELVQQLDHPADQPLRSTASRLELAMLVARQKRHKEGTTICGFKIGINEIALVEDRYAGARYVCTMRDPRDVVASQLKRGFDRSPVQIARSWAGYASQLHQWQRRANDRLCVIRYEELVTEPGRVLEGVFSHLGIAYDAAVLRFFDSKASVHQPGQSHANAEALRQDFFTSSIGQWSALPEADIRHIEDIAVDAMHQYGYEPAFVRSRYSTWRRVRNGLRSMTLSLRSAIR